MDKTPLFLSYRTSNLGDDIQTLAAISRCVGADRSLENLEFIDRDFPDFGALKHDIGHYSLDLNCWLSSRPDHPGFPEELETTVTSIHLNYEPDAVPEAMQAWLRRCGAIGCRDLWTRAVLRRLDIPAGFRVCPTTELEHRYFDAEPEFENALVLVDADNPFDIDVTHRLTHRINPKTPMARDTQARLSVARKLLSIYAHARGVVTTRLHAFLPCVAFGTPVYFIDTGRDTSRFGGYEALIEIERMRFKATMGL